MTDHSQGSPLQRLAKLAAQQGATPGGAQGCEMDWTYTEFSPASTPNASGLSGSGRYWGFQTCNEFGFYQTCEKGSRCFYAQGYTGFSGSAAEHKPNAFCQTAFDISEAATNRSIVESNQFYGALLANASRILWPNGASVVLRVFYGMGGDRSSRSLEWIIGVGADERRPASAGG